MHSHQWKRRQFITLLGGAAAWPITASSQPAGKLPTIGYLGSTTPASQGQLRAGFVERLRALGWIEGRNVVIETRWAEGLSERFGEIAAEFIRLKVDIIVASGTEAVAATKQATSVIPIVFAAAGDPVGSGLVASLARPGGNVTGLSLQQTDTAGKRLELLREMVPGLRRLAILGNIAGASAALDMHEVEATSRTLGIEPTILKVRRVEDITLGFEAIKDRADALYVVIDPLVNTHRFRLNTLTLGARLPTMHTTRDLVELGGLMSYGANFPEVFRRAADFVDKILRGTKPADLPIEQPTKFDLVVNLITAKVLGLNVPATLLARADEVIE